jgi:hypothetical protein
MRDMHRIRVIVGPLGCLSNDSEFLTPTGWKRMDAYTEGDLVAEWDPSTSETVFRKPTRYIVEPSSTLLWFRNKHGLSMQVSDEHRMPLYDREEQFVVKTAIEVATDNRNYAVPIFFTPQRQGLNWSEPELRLAVAINADGHHPKAGFKTVIHLSKERKITRLRELLDNCGVDFDETAYDNGTTNFSFHSPYKGKHYDGEWWNATPAQLAIILDEMSHWDGLANHTETRFYSAYKADADFIQYAAHACGRRAGLKVITRSNKPEWNTEYLVQISKTNGQRNRTLIHRESVRINRINAVDGKKYCFETNSGYFVTRHHNKVFITGNSGKTMGCIMELVRWACAQPAWNKTRYTRFALIRNTLQQLRQTVLADAVSYLQGVVHFYTTDSTLQLRLNLPDGTHVHSDWPLIPLDSKEDVRRLLSMQLTGAYINELREVPFEIIRPLLGRCGRYPSKAMGGALKRGIIADTNPWDTDAPYHDRLVLNPHPAWKLFHQPSGLSPLAENIENLAEGYYDELMDDKDLDWAAVHVESQWGTSNAGQAVFRKSFHAPSHVRDMKVVVNPAKPIMVGLDFGRTPCAVIGQHDNYGRAIIFKEVVTEGMGLIQMVEEHLKPVLLSPPFAGKRVFIVGDPAGRQRSQVSESTPFDDLNDLGFLAYPASTNAIDARLTAVEKLMRSTIMEQPALQISREGCPVLVQSLGNKYRYRRRRDGQLDDLPEKQHPWSDVVDALQYFCLGTQSNYTARVMRRDRPRVSQARELVTAAGWT